MIREKLARLIWPEVTTTIAGMERTIETLGKRLAMSHENENKTLDALATLQGEDHKRAVEYGGALSSAATAVSRHNILLEALKRALPYVKEADGLAGEELKKARSKTKKASWEATKAATAADLTFITQAIQPDAKRDEAVRKTASLLKPNTLTARVPVTAEHGVAHAGQ